jgi:WD40 repeat protein
LWNIATNREVAVLSHPGDVRWVSFTTDGKTLVTAHPRSVRIWNLAGAMEKLALSGHEGGVPGTTFSPDGKLLVSVGKDMKATIWDPATGQVIHRLAGFGGVLHAVTFSPDGRLLAIGDRAGTIRIWEVGTWQELPTPAHDIGQQIWSVAFSPDGRYIAACAYPGVSALWRVEFFPSSQGHEARLSLEKLDQFSVRDAQFLCFSPDSKLLAWSSGNTAFVWDLVESRSRPALPAQLISPLSSLAFCPDSKQIALIGPTLTPEVWDVTTGKKLFSLPGGESERRRHLFIASVIALSADGAWLAQQGTAIKVWDLKTRKLLLELPQEHSTPWCLAWSPNKELLAVGSEQEGIAIWNLPKIRTQLAEIGLGW